MNVPNITVRMSGLPYEFSNILSGSITLAANEGGTALSLRLSDVNHKMANDLIKHSMATGGIQGVPQPVEPAITPSNVPAIDQAVKDIPNDPGKPFSYSLQWNTIKLAIVKECLRSGLTLPDQIAYVLATADGESGKGRDLIEIWGNSAAQQSYQGRLGNTNPGDGFTYRGRGLSQTTGKERYVYWSKILGVDLVKNPDIMAQLPVAIPVLVQGMRDGGFTGRKLSRYINEKGTDFYNARRVINGIVPAQMPTYNNAFKRYQTEVPALIAQAVASLSSEKKPKETPTLLIKSTKPDAVPTTVTSVTPLVSATETTPVVKGNMLIVQWFSIEMTFFHTGTEVDNGGVTTLTGQGLRWVMNRRKRTKAISGLTFSALAERVGRTHGIEVRYKAAYDPSFIVVEQTGISDYQLLKREAGRSGLFISEEPGAILIQSLSQIRDTSIVLEVGKNLLKWAVKDKAISADDTYEQPDSLLTGEVKGAIDPLTGKVIQTIPDVDPTKGAKDATGTTPSKAPIGGKLLPGQEIKALQNVQRTKRVKGLPSQFSVVTDDTMLTLTPLSALRTKGISEYLDRVWLINKVTHTTDGTTTIECFSPVEVLDITQPTVSPTTTPAVVNLINDATPGLFIVPCNGSVTSLVGVRRSPTAGASSHHKGTDIGGVRGAPIIASQSGVVTIAAVQSGYGNVIYLKHANGFESRYAHLEGFNVKQNATVAKGDVIGFMGSTGVGTGVHLHFEVRQNGNPLTPVQFGLPSISKVGNKAVQGATK